MNHPRTLLELVNNPELKQRLPETVKLPEVKLLGDADEIDPNLLDCLESWPERLSLPLEACPVCGVEWKRLSRLRLWPKDADVRVIIYDEETLKVEAAQCATCSYIFPLGALLDPDNDAFVKESRDRWQRGAWTGED